MRTASFLFCLTLSPLVCAEGVKSIEPNMGFNEFLDKIEALYLAQGDGIFIYKILLNKGMKDQEKVLAVCKSMVTTLDVRLFAISMSLSNVQCGY